MTLSIFSRPDVQLERQLFEPSLRESIFAIGYAMVLYVLGLASYMVFASQGVLFAIAAFPLLVLAAFGMFLQGVLGHEGFHFNLGRNRYVSCLLGIFCSSMLSGFCVTGYATDHWRHHRSNNSSKDPDLQLLSRYQNLLTRALFSRLAATARYGRLTLRLANGDSVLAASIPLPAPQVHRLARINLACQVGWLGLHFAVASWLPGFLFAWMGMLAIVVLISGLNAYQEHAFACHQIAGPARSRSSPVCSVLYLGSNYHLEHHLYPKVPCWRLGRIHRVLQDSGWYADKASLVEPGFFSSFRFGLARYTYKNPEPTL